MATGLVAEQLMARKLMAKNHLFILILKRNEHKEQDDLASKQPCNGEHCGRQRHTSDVGGDGMHIIAANTEIICTTSSLRAALDKALRNLPEARAKAISETRPIATS